MKLNLAIDLLPGYHHMWNIKNVLDGRTDGRTDRPKTRHGDISSGSGPKNDIFAIIAHAVRCIAGIYIDNKYWTQLSS